MMGDHYCGHCGSVLDAMVVTAEGDDIEFCSKACMIKFHGVKSTAFESQVGGDHYKKLGPYQPWEVLAKWMTPDELKGFMKGTVIAYLARENDKGGMGDIRKAAHTMQIYLELVDRQASKDRG